MTLTQILQKIKSTFYTKSEVDTSLSGYLPLSGGAMTGGISKTSNDKSLQLLGGTGWDKGASLILFGMTGNDVAVPAYGEFFIDAHNGTVWKRLRGTPNGTLIWSGQPIQYGSDQRLKQQIVEIDDKLLDAWEDVIQYQFKYNDAVDQKGDNARLHTGYVVQQIDEACKKHNLDISKYGLYCHEEYPEESEEIEIEQEDGTKIKERKVIREASEHYSLRYTETLVIECAYLKRENSRLKERLEKLEERLAKLENQ